MPGSGKAIKEEEAQLINVLHMSHEAAQHTEDLRIQYCSHHLQH